MSGGNFFLNNFFSCFHNQLIWLQISEQQVAIKFFSLATDILLAIFDLSSGIEAQTVLH